MSAKPRLVASPAQIVPPVSVTIEGRDRHFVADALIEAAIKLEQDARSRRRRATMALTLEKIAGRLRALAARVT